MQVGNELGEAPVIGEHPPGAGDGAVELGRGVHLERVAVPGDLLLE